MTIIDNAVYVNGIRTATPESLEQSVETLAAHGGMVWIGLYRPDETEMAAVAAEFGLHLLAVEDAVNAHQRPKLERYDNNLFTVLRPARYVDATETVEFGELHIFTASSVRWMPCCLESTSCVSTNSTCTMWVTGCSSPSSSGQRPNGESRSW